jgi:prolyl-tRNA synthetase
MKDSYSLDADWAGLDKQYDLHYQAYFNIFRRCGLPVIAVKSDVGMMGGSLAHEFMYLNPIGEDTLLLCDACGYSANRQIASTRKPQPAQEPLLALEKVSTPACKTIDELARYLGVPKSRTAKAVFLVASVPLEDNQVPDQQKTSEERFIFTILRGDMEVNETKLANLLKARALRPATEEEIRMIGAVPGYASPVGLQATIVVDDLIPESPNLIAGANQEGYHLRNVNYGRDYQAQYVADIVAAQAGDGCPQCGASLRAERGVEVGNIFKLGTRYSEALGCTFTDQDGAEKPVIMGSYGIGSGRLLACIAEQHHDEAGLVWPASVAPFQVHLVGLVGKDINSPTRELAEALYRALQEAGIEVLYDDRPESPGVKFNDADLIGLPIRLTVSERALKQGGVEYKQRDQAEKLILPLDPGGGFAPLLTHVSAEITALQGELR